MNGSRQRGNADIQSGRSQNSILLGLNTRGSPSTAPGDSRSLRVAGCTASVWNIWCVLFPLTSTLSLGERETQGPIFPLSRRLDPLLNQDLRQSTVTGRCSAIRSLGRCFSLRSSRLCVESARPKCLGLSCTPSGQDRLRLGFVVAGRKTQRREERRDPSSGDLLRKGLELTEPVSRFMGRETQGPIFPLSRRFDSLTDWRGFSLSLRERAGVRGKGRTILPLAPSTRLPLLRFMVRGKGARKLQPACFTPASGLSAGPAKERPRDGAA
jgi:hypothetical protein